MSGGIGYFLDLDLDRLNTEMVDALEPSDADLEFLADWSSATTRRPSLRWPRRCWPNWTAQPALTKVLPRDYARVLAAREQAESEGRTRRRSPTA